MYIECTNVYTDVWMYAFLSWCHENSEQTLVAFDSNDEYWWIEHVLCAINSNEYLNERE